MQGGTRGELDIAALLGKRGAVIATSLRARPAGEKATIVAAVREHVWPLIAAGQVPADRAVAASPRRGRDAHRELEASDHVGKVLLTTG